jgi:hypothetical protein
VKDGAKCGMPLFVIPGLREAQNPESSLFPRPSTKELDSGSPLRGVRNDGVKDGAKVQNGMME